MKDIQNTEQEHLHKCAEGDENCNCEDHEDDGNIITLEMEDGTSKDFQVLDILEHKNKQYIALAEVDSFEYDIMNFTVNDEVMELHVIEDEVEFNEIAVLFEEHFATMDAEDEEDDEDEE
jgi:hypothetical protein